MMRSSHLMAAFVVVLVAAAHASSELVDLGEDTLANAPNLSGDTKLSALKEKVNSLKAENTAAQDKITVLKANAGAWSVEASRSAASSRVAAATAEALERKVAYGRKSMKRRLDNMQRKINLEVEARNQKMKKHSAEMAASEAELDSEIKQIAGKSAAADKMLAERIKRVAKNKKQIMTTQQQEDHLKKLSLEGETMLHKVRLRARSRKSLISRKKKKEEAKVKETQKELKKLGDKYKRLEAAP